MSLLKHDNIVALRKKDQLNIERKLGHVFPGFEEGLLTFPPTYKFQPGTDVYETRPEKKLRPPAWCDRVLWREPANKGADRTVRQKSYRISRLRPSDHKPVGSSFDVETRVVDPEREKYAYLKLVRDLDRMENEEQPRVEIDPSLEFVISDVHFQDRRRADLYIKNVGSAIANWRFVSKNCDMKLSEPWIHLEPHLGMVAPGEVGHVVIEIFIDYRSVDLLST
ncbi:Ocrl, partial [Symbiodinium microadriaticum]